MQWQRQVCFVQLWEARELEESSLYSMQLFACGCRSSYLLTPCRRLIPTRHFMVDNLDSAQQIQICGKTRNLLPSLRVNIDYGRLDCLKVIVDVQLSEIQGGIVVDSRGVSILYHQRHSSYQFPAWCRSRQDPQQGTGQYLSTRF